MPPNGRASPGAGRCRLARLRGERYPRDRALRVQQQTRDHYQDMLTVRVHVEAVALDRFPDLAFKRNEVTRETVVRVVHFGGLSGFTPNAAAHQTHRLTPCRGLRALASAASNSGLMPLKGQSPEGLAGVDSLATLNGKKRTDARHIGLIANYRPFGALVAGETTEADYLGIFDLWNQDDVTTRRATSLARAD